MTDWMIVYTTHDLTEAHIMAGRLEVENIKSIIHRQTVAGVYGITIGPIGEIQVVVHPSEYERALAILEPDELYTLTDDNDKIIYYNYHSDEDDDPE
jgi:hypothetical protein